MLRLWRDHGLSVSQGAVRKTFGVRERMLHRAKEILYKNEGEIVRVRNTVPVLVNHSWQIEREISSIAQTYKG